MATPAPPAKAPPADAKTKQTPKLTFGSLIPLVIIHALSFIAFVIYLAGVSAAEHQARSANLDSTERENYLSFPWFLLVAYVVAMGLHAVVMVVPHLHFLKLFVALLLAIVVAWFGKSLDETMALTRTYDVYDHSLPHISDTVSALRCLDAGGVLCVLAMLAALALISIDVGRHSSSPTPAQAPYAAPQVTGGEISMRQATCPKCSTTTSYPPEYEAVCCPSCQTVIQVGATAV